MRDEASAWCSGSREAITAGVDLIQLRERDSAGPLLADVAGPWTAAAGSSTRVVVNDLRADVAMRAGVTASIARADGPPWPASRIEAAWVRSAV